MLLSDFFKTELVDYASYSTLRMIGSLVDGQKNSSRKVLYTILDKNIKNELKVSQLASKVAEYSEYLHGDVSLQTVITGMAKDYAGSNNMNLLVPEGTFGTRFANEASAPRYIYSYGSKFLWGLFNKDDSNVVIHQSFEGDKIEPKFYVPTLPLLLINGSNGIASGFKQEILPRDVENIIKFLKNEIQGKRNLKKYLVPSYKGFKGSIEPTEKENQWVIKGTLEKIGKNKIKISEVPIGFDLKGYHKILDALEEDKFLRSYIDDSEDDSFSFTVTLPTKNYSLSEDELMQKFKLVKLVSENFVVLNENNKIEQYNSPEEVLSHYIKIKREFLDRRKKYQLIKIEEELKVLASKYIFIKMVVDETIIVNNRKKVLIIEQIEKENNNRIIKVDDSYDYLLRMPIWSLTTEKMSELKNKIKDMKKEYDSLKKTDIIDIWIDEINSIESIYRKGK